MGKGGRRLKYFSIALEAHVDLIVLLMLHFGTTFLVTIQWHESKVVCFGVGVCDCHVTQYCPVAHSLSPLPPYLPILTSSPSPPPAA